MQAQHHLSSEDSAKLKIHIFQFLANISPPKEQYKITAIILSQAKHMKYYTLMMKNEKTELYTIIIIIIIYSSSFLSCEIFVFLINMVLLKGTLLCFRNQKVFKQTKR